MVITLEEYKKRNAEYQKKWREAQKLKNSDEYRELRTKQQQEYRSKIKQQLQVESVEIPKKKIKLDKLPVGHYKAKMDDFKSKIDELDMNETTIKNHISKIKFMYKLLKSQDLSDDVINNLNLLFQKNEKANIKLIKDTFNVLFKRSTNTTIKKIREYYTNDNSFSANIKTLAILCNYLQRGFKKEYQHLSKIYMKFDSNYINEKEKHQIDDANKNKLISFDSDNIIKNYNSIDNIKNRIIYGLCMFMVRRLEIGKLKITSNPPDDSKDNWLDYVNYKCIFNTYKTSKTYGKQIIDIPDIMKDDIINYIKIRGIKDDDYLLPYPKQIGPNISKIMEDIYGIKISMNWVRQSFATYNDSSKLKVINEFNDNASKLAHSAAEHSRYIRSEI